MKEEECQLRKCLTKEEICELINEKAATGRSTITGESAQTSSSTSPVHSSPKTPSKSTLSSNKLATTPLKLVGPRKESTKTPIKSFQIQIESSQEVAGFQSVADFNETYPNWRQINLEGNIDSQSEVESSATSSKSTKIVSSIVITPFVSIGSKYCLHQAIPAAENDVDSLFEVASPETNSKSTKVASRIDISPFSSSAMKYGTKNASLEKIQKIFNRYY